MADDDTIETTLEHGVSEIALGTKPSLFLMIRDRRDARVIPLRDGERIVIGRAPPSEVRIQDPSLSRQHAAITRRGHTVVIEDLDSKNGLRVGTELRKDVELTPGLVARLGAVKVSLHTTDASRDGWLSHAYFVRRVDEEVERARRFGRTFALLFVRTIGGEANLDLLIPRIDGLMRQGERACVYGERALYLLLPELEREEAFRFAQRVAQTGPGEASVRVGASLFPNDGAQAAALLGEARASAKRANADQKVVFSDGRASESGPLIASDAMRKLYETIERVAPSQLDVLIYGETGSGKELVAQTIHGSSGKRADGPLRSINCGALSDTLLQSALFGHVRGAFTGAIDDHVGLFESANGGTVFLDEVGELSGAAQAALLRVLETRRVTRVGGTEEKPVDVRIVSATHRTLRDAEGFRQDLLYRLEGIALEVPPLRERIDEIVPLAEHFLQQSESGRTLSEAAKEALKAYPWPGNVRELRNAIERAAVISASDVIEPDTLPAPTSSTTTSHGLDVAPTADRPFKERVQDYEQKLILDALERHEGNQTAAARALRMPLRTLVHKIRAYGIKKKFE